MFLKLITAHCTKQKLVINVSSLELGLSIMNVLLYACQRGVAKSWEDESFFFESITNIQFGQDPNCQPQLVPVLYTCNVAIINESSMLQSLHFMKKIPPGAEAANILVGEVDFLNHPVVTFVRLLHPIILRDLTEVPVPTKFVFILLGPMGNQSKYHEIGRSIATLMSDEVRFLRVHALAEIFPFIVIENRNLCHIQFIEGCNKTRFFYDKQF